MSHLSLRVLLIRFCLFWAILAHFSAFSQGKKKPAPRVGSTIVNDSSKSVYGPSTVRWTTEKDLFENRNNYRPLDTTIHNYHRWTYVQMFNNNYKDLGVMGTALNSIFPTVSSVIGASSGFQVYEPYYATEEPHYYDTKSPFTRMYVIWGGIGRAMTKVEFSRNINPRWNFGFNYRPILVDKQIQRTGKGDRQTVSQYYDFFTTYRTKNDKYFLLLNYRRIRHKVNENGGVDLLPTDDPFLKLFDPNARINLVAAKSEEYRRNYHIFQQYKLANALQIYHKADFTKQDDVFTDFPQKESSYTFDHYEPVSADTTFDKTIFTTMQQEAGVKGNAAKLFYSMYVKLRTFEYKNRYLDTVATQVQKSGTEKYVGGQLAVRLDSVSEVSGSAEYLLDGYYRVDGQIQTPWIEGFFKTSLSKPGFMQQLYRGAHDFWNKPMAATNSTQAQGFLKWGTKFLRIKVGGTFTLLNNYVYFRDALPADTARHQTVLPYQSSGTQSVMLPEINANVRVLRHLFFRPQVIYRIYNANDDDALRIPQMFVNAQISYENQLFKNHIQVQTGVDVHWKSTYQATSYDPVIQQFYLQNSTVNPAYPQTDITVSPAYPLVDVFFTGKMRRARFFFKYHNLMQLFKVARDPATNNLINYGYVPTPGYPGQRNVIDFGFDFLLFD